MNPKTHYELLLIGDDKSNEVWEREGLIPGKVKFCDELMVKKGREIYLTDKTDLVTCKKCRKKINKIILKHLEV